MRALRPSWSTSGSLGGYLGSCTFAHWDQGISTSLNTSSPQGLETVLPRMGPSSTPRGARGSEHRLRTRRRQEAQPGTVRDKQDRGGKTGVGTSGSEMLCPTRPVPGTGVVPAPRVSQPPSPRTRGALTPRSSRRGTRCPAHPGRIRAPQRFPWRWHLPSPHRPSRGFPWRCRIQHGTT